MTIPSSNDPLETELGRVVRALRGQPAGPLTPLVAQQVAACLVALDPSASSLAARVPTMDGAWAAGVVASVTHDARTAQNENPRANETALSAALAGLRRGMTSS